MSKNTREANFRKVDVDELDEEQYRDDATDVDSEDHSSQIGQREAEVRKLLSNSSNTDALKVCLSDPPVGSKDKALKERNFNIVLDVLTRFKAAEVEKAINSLNTDQVDILMKYVYRGFAFPTENSCGILLVWHDKAVASAGVGSIMRVITDRKTV